jgi:hypothetical protein
VTASPAVDIRCRQCHRTEGVTVLRRARRRTRYACSTCGAVVTEVPVFAVPVPQPTGAAPGSEFDDVMPPEMVAWVVASPRRLARAANLDRATIYELYAAWDAYAAAPDAPRPPSFRTVVGALHAAAYHMESVVSTMTATAPDATVAIRARAEHARAWLHRSGTAHCWIHGTPQAAPDRDLIEAALGCLRAGTAPDQDQARAARIALFGVSGGPGLHALVEVYPMPQMARALAEYVRTGAQPLRADVLAHLAGEAG